MALEGDLSLFGLSDVLQIVAQQRKTGILTIQGRSDILAVSFLNGEIVAADALNQSFEGLLGDVLARRGGVSRDRFAIVAERQRSSGERLVDFLVNQGIVGREELLDALRELTYRLLVDVLRWREGQFKFYGGEEVAFEDGIVPLRVDEVLMEALSEVADEPNRAGAVPHGYLAYQRVPSSKEIREIPAGFDETTPLDTSVTWLTPEERHLLDKLDGRTPVELLARQLGMGEAKAYFALHRLLQAGLARPASDDEAPPSRPQRMAPTAATAPRRETLRLGHEAIAELAPAATSPRRANSIASGLALAVPLALAATLVFSAWTVPGAVLFATPELGPSREGFQRLRRLSRSDLIDRAARTHYLLEGRYPTGLEELVRLELLPRRARFDPSGEAYRMQSSSEQYSLAAAENLEVSLSAREGVFGDFLLDRELFSNLEKERGVPLVLID